MSPAQASATGTTQASVPPPSGTTAPLADTASIAQQLEQARASVQQLLAQVGPNAAVGAAAGGGAAAAAPAPEAPKPPAPPSPTQKKAKAGKGKGKAAPKDKPGGSDPAVNGARNSVRYMLQVVSSMAGLEDLKPELQWLIRDARFKVVPDNQLQGHHADAEYDFQSGRVLIPESLVREIKNLRKSTFDWKPGALKKYDNDPLVAAHRDAVVTQKGVRDTDRWHRLATGLALIVHEAKHAEQHQNGQLAGFEQQINLAYEQGGPDAAIRAFATLIELPAQRAQERAQFLLKEPPEEGGWLTLTRDGKALTDEQAVNRIIAKRRTQLAEALFGPGGVPTQEGVAPMQGDPNAPGWRYPGWRYPGWRYPGWRYPGQRGE